MPTTTVERPSRKLDTLQSAYRTDTARQEPTLGKPLAVALCTATRVQLLSLSVDECFTCIPTCTCMQYMHTYLSYNRRAGVSHNQ